MQDSDRPIAANKEGYSLIEVLVAVLILAVVTLGIVAILPAGYTQITNSGRISVMSHLGQQKLDQLRGLNWANADLTEGPHPATAEWPLTEAKRYSVTWEVDNCPATPADCPTTTVSGDAKLIVVTVGYDLYRSDGTTVIPASESLGQETYQFKTVITK